MQTIHDWVDLRARLTAGLAAFFDAPYQGLLPLHRYVLVDAAQVPDMRGPQFEEEQLEHLSLFTLTREHAIAKYGPLLIPLSAHASAGSPSVARIMRAMRHGWTVSWISSTLELDALGQHLAGHLNGTLPDGSDVLVRYYDPRLLPAFLSQLDPATCDALLGPVVHWGWWNRDLDFVLQQGAGTNSSQGITDTRIGQGTQDAMAQAALVDLIASMVLGESESEEFEDWLPHALYQAVAGQVAQARARGLTEQGDLQLYVSLALRIHPDFFTLLPVFARQQAQLREGDIELPTLVLEVQDEDWDRLGGSGRDVLSHLRQKITRQLSTKHMEAINAHS